MNKLEECKWLIDRIDRMRSSVSARATVLLSANAIIAAVFISTLKEPKPISVQTYLETFGLIMVFFAIGSLAISIVYSISAIMDPWRRFRKKYPDVPDRNLIGPNNTLSNIKIFKDFNREFEGINDEEYIKRLLAEYWACILQYRDRIYNLKKGSRYFVISAILFAIIFLITYASKIKI